MPTTKSQGIALEELIAQVQRHSTVTELFKLANSEGFKAAAHGLSPEELVTLRKAYREHHKSLDGRVKLEEFDGQVIDIIDLDFGHSDRFEDNASGGEFIALRFRPIGSTQSYRALTSSARWIRFARGFKKPPSAAEPARVFISLEPVSDPERAAKGQRQWRVKRMAGPQESNAEGAPF